MKALLLGGPYDSKELEVLSPLPTLWLPVMEEVGDIPDLREHDDTQWDEHPVDTAVYTRVGGHTDAGQMVYLYTVVDAKETGCRSAEPSCTIGTLGISDQTPPALVRCDAAGAHPCCTVGGSMCNHAEAHIPDGGGVDLGDGYLTCARQTACAWTEDGEEHSCTCSCKPTEEV